MDYIWCSSCYVFLKNRDDMQKHEESMTHIASKRSYEEVGTHSNPTDVEQKDDQKSRHGTASNIIGPKTVCLEYNVEHLWREIYKAEGNKGTNFLFAMTNVFYCRHCKVRKHVTEVLEHAHGLEHQKAINTEINIIIGRKMKQEEERLWETIHPSFRSHQTYVRLWNVTCLFCFLCETNISAGNAINLSHHIIGKTHMKNMIFYLQSIYSILKGIYLNPDILSLLHFSNSKSNKMIFEKIIDPTDDIQLKKLHSLLNKINTDEKKSFCHIRCICILCGMEYDSGTLWLNHINGRFHKQNVENQNKFGKKIGKYVCSICSIIMFGKEYDHHCLHNGFVPRVTITGYDKKATLEDLYDVLKTYGIIKNCALRPQEAIFEFEDKKTIDNLLWRKINFEGHLLNIKPLNFMELQDSGTTTQANECFEQVFSSMESFNCKIKSICEKMDSTSNESSEDVARFLEKELSKAFETRVNIYLFGSRVSGIGFPDSDVDVFADTGNMYSGNHGQETSVQEHKVMITCSTLEAHPDCEKVSPVPTARIPIVKFKYKPTNLDCDISFRHGLSHENTKLVRFFLSLDPSMKPLIGFLKFWLKDNKLSGSNKFTTYAFVWLVIFFLQQLPDINFPTVEELQTGVEANIIGGWLCSFSVDRSALAFVRIPHPVLQLVCEFFKFYSKFDFETFVVCPLTGKPELKIVFKASPANLPGSMQEYVKKLDSNHCTAMSVTVCCVQDPFELNQNICKAISRESVKKFQKCCASTLQLCTKLENEGHT